MLLPTITTKLLLAAWLPQVALAVFADDAYHVDYHYALLGAPQQHATFFHQPHAASKASLLYTLSDKYVLGAINPKDGSLIWRQRLSSNSSASFLRAGEGQDIVISAVDDQVAAWDATDGRLVWDSSFRNAHVRDLEVIELEDASTSAGAKDALVMFGGSNPAVMRLNGQSGAMKWAFEDTSGDVPFQVSTSATAIHAISLSSAMLGGLKIKVVSVDPLTGHKIDQYTLTSESDISSPDDILFVGANSASPILAWTDKSHKTLKLNLIGTKGISSLNIENHTGEEIEKVVLHAPHRTISVPHFLVHYQTSKSHWADVYHADLKTGSFSKAYSLPKLSGKGAFSTSTTDANVYFTRVSSDEVTVVSSASDDVLGHWPVKKDTPDHAEAVKSPLHAVSEVVVKSGGASAVRSAVFVSAGNWNMLRNGDSTWSRPESLAGTVDAVFVDLPDQESLVQELEIETHQNALAAYIHRVKRHVKDLEHLPQFLQNLPKRFMPAAETQDKPQTDTFGFNKPVVVATETGRFIALRSGKIIWNSDILNLPMGKKIDKIELRVTSTGLIEADIPELSKLVLLDVSTGLALPATPNEAKHPLDTEKASPAFSYRVVDGDLKGYWSGSDLAWQFVPTAGERIINVTPRPALDPVASIGKVLGDRRVLYKYLNPNLVLVTAVTDATGILSVYLLDSVSGVLLYEASHEGVDMMQPIPSALSENWITYSFTLSSNGEAPSRGHQLVVAEFFESTLPNDRGPFGASSNYSSIQPTGAVGEAAKPHVLSQTYHIPEAISHMAITQTAQGITSKWLLVTLAESNSIVGIPRNFIDPRRPVGRDPTADEAIEGLLRYTPVIEFDPRQYLNHKREVYGVEKVLTSPALMESTSLVFAYGLDVFGTRVTPSFSFDVLGKDFNRFQLVTTVAALAVTVFFVAPLVRRKQINARWQIS
ncbi:uncharacterized protein K452DRAFT_233269 [Aplosporella prunicola CBS 121167]|uniref:ER membrane protein complex subunit 1 n=1 Tax=Aplosporella prunicola CBS 121167 TaxID=1176127 RepID=A0A6A6B4V1_9PEZI|nr:uncharacterized protein K452DRAFT_233269 [Aplosporella prunicola CBS 121167]KAF2139060.1 hypothetical protein K452DRAFT_233269 [Aplosporella prunicola CBS 121167]